MILLAFARSLPAHAAEINAADLPACWRLATNQVESNPPQHYAATADTAIVYSGHASVRLESVDPGAQHGWLFQGIEAAAFAGRGVEFSASLRTAALQAGFQLWLIATDARGRIVAEQGFAWDRSDRDWHARSIRADVPATAAALYFGFRLLTTGTLWADAVALRPVAARPAAPTPPAERWLGTWPAPVAAALLPAPANLDFELAPPAGEDPCR